MTLIEKVHTALFALVLLAVCGLGYGLYELHTENAAKAKADTTAATAQTAINADEADVSAVNKELTVQLAAIAAQARQPATAPQVVLDMSRILPSGTTLPQPIQVVQPPPVEMKNAAGVTTETPSQPEVVIPQVDFAAIQASTLACEVNGVKLTACTTNLAATTDEVAQTAKQRDAYKEALNGGTFWTRLKNSAVNAGCGGAGAFAGIKVADGAGGTSTNGAIAGGSTFAGCELTAWLIGRKHKSKEVAP